MAPLQNPPKYLMCPVHILFRGMVSLAKNPKAGSTAIQLHGTQHLIASNMNSSHSINSSLALLLYFILEIIDGCRVLY